MTATLPAPAAESAEDRVGAIEAAGVEYLPEEARDSGPRNLSAVFLGANLTWTNVVFGAFAILFGLSFWQTVASMAIGTAVGTLAVLPTAIIGPRTGTNMTVSSGAFFGIRGRFIGSGLALAIALAFAAVTVWTSGDALVAAGHRLLGTPESDIVHAVAYAAVAALMVTVALYGHATIVAIQKVVVPVVGGLMILGVLAFAGGFDPALRAANTRWAASGRPGRCRRCSSPQRRSRTVRPSATTPGASRPFGSATGRSARRSGSGCSSGCCCPACSARSPR